MYPTRCSNVWAASSGGCARVTYVHVHKAHGLLWVWSTGVVNTKCHIIFVAILARVVDLKQSQAASLTFAQMPIYISRSGNFRTDNDNRRLPYPLRGVIISSLVPRPHPLWITTQSLDQEKEFGRWLSKSHDYLPHRHHAEEVGQVWPLAIRSLIK